MTKSRNSLQFLILLKNNSQQRNGYSNMITFRQYHLLMRSITRQANKRTNSDALRLVQTAYSSTNASSPGIVRSALKYSLAAILGTSAGVLTGYYLMLDQYKLMNDDRNQMSRSFLPEEFQSTRFVCVFHIIEIAC